MDIRIQAVAPSEIEALQADLTEIYRQAFREPPYAKSLAEMEAFARWLPTHALQPGFRLILVVDSEKDEPLGFAYGRTASEGHGWYDVVKASLGPAGLDTWLSDAYQIVEMAVIPAAQRRGLAGRLHDHLLAGLPHERALLTTLAADTPAYHLYLKKGWGVRVDGIAVTDIPRRYRAMGLEFPLARGVEMTGPGVVIP
jgi:GNAT superfamily N-acetyltransferase